MTRPTSCILLCVLLAIGVALGGCGKAREAAQTAREVGEATRFAKDMQDGKATFKTNEGEGEVEVDKDAETMTITTTDQEGKETTITSSKDADLSKLGLATYPGAQQEGSSTVTADEGGHMTVVLTTADPFDKVAQFYKDKYPDVGKHEVSGPDGSQMLMMHVSEAPQVKTVMVTKDKGDDKVHIALVSVSEEKTE